MKEVSVHQNKILQLENGLAVKEKDLTECSRRLTELTKDQEVLKTESQKAESRVADLTTELEEQKSLKNSEINFRV